MKTKVSLKYFVNDFLWKQFFALTSPRIPMVLICLRILVSLRPFTKFQAKSRASNFKKALNFDLLGNSFSDLFSEVKIWH